MSRSVWISLALAAVLSSSCAHARYMAPPTPARPSFTAAWDIRSPLLRGAVDILLARSPSFQDAVTHLRRPIVFRVGYAGERAVPSIGREYVALAVPPDRMPADTLVIVLGTSAIESSALLRGYPLDSLRMDLAVVIGHEVYGHLVPFVEGGASLWPPVCDDTERPGKASCAVARENVVRRELRVPARRSNADIALGFICRAAEKACPTTR